MDARTALKFSAYYHALGLVASILGLVVAASGVYLGLRGSLSAVSLANPASILGALSLQGVAIALAGLVLGFYVHRVGRTAARLKVDTMAVDEGVDLPSTSVLSRKVAGEVSTQVGEEVSEVVSHVTGDDQEFAFEGTDEQQSRERADGAPTSD